MWLLRNTQISLFPSTKAWTTRHWLSFLGSWEWRSDPQIWPAMRSKVSFWWCLTIGNMNISKAKATSKAFRQVKKSYTSIRLLRTWYHLIQGYMAKKGILSQNELLGLVIMIFFYNKTWNRDKIAVPYILSIAYETADFFNLFGKFTIHQFPGAASAGSSGSSSGSSKT